MARSSESPTLRGLAKLEAAVAEARGREAQAESERRGAERAVAVVEARLRGVHEEAADRGEEPDPERVANLRLELREAHERAEPARLQGLLAGAKRARERAEEEARRFAASNLDGLREDRRAGDEAAARRLAAAVDEFVEADAEWSHRQGFHVRLCALVGIAVELHERPLPVPGQLLADYHRRRETDPDSTVPGNRGRHREDAA